MRVQRWPVLLAAAATLVPSGVVARATTGPVPAPGSPPRAVLFLVDGSDAMLAPLADGRSRWEAVRDAVATTAGELPEGALVGLRVAGSDPAVAPPGCADTRLVAPAAPLDRAALGSALAPLVPAGPSSTAEGLRAAVDDLPANAEAAVVLVAGRLGGCVPGETCGAVHDLVARGVGLRVDAVAVGADPVTLDELRCVTEATGGSLRLAAATPDVVAGLTRTALRALSPLARATVQPVRHDGDAPVLLATGAHGDVLRPGESRRYLVELAEGAELLATLDAAAPPELADRVVLRLSVGGAADPVAAGGGAADPVAAGGEAVGLGSAVTDAVLLGLARESLRARTGPSAGPEPSSGSSEPGGGLGASPGASAEGTPEPTGTPHPPRMVPVDVALEPFGAGVLPPVEVPVVLALDVVDTVLVVQEPPAPVVGQPPALPPERVVVVRDRVPVWAWGLVGALLCAVAALALVLGTWAAPRRHRPDAGR